jgi:calcineurin-like phosphoesterase family protein
MESMSIQIEADKAFFWSDLHLFHKAAAKARGTDVETMNRELLEQALHLGPEVTLFFLGDVSFGKYAETKAWLDRLHCKKILVVGNHDSGLAKHLDELFDEVHHLLRVKVVEYTGPEGHKKKNKLAEIICCHYPLLVWDKMHHGSWHLHGHCHGSLQYPDNNSGKSLDVGVDAFGHLGPVRFNWLQEKMARCQIVSRDHHKPDIIERGDWTL